MNDQQKKEQYSGVRDQEIRAALDQDWAGQTAIATYPRPNTQAHRFLTVKGNCDRENCAIKQEVSL
jgi:predicted phosphodiesterase